MGRAVSLTAALLALAGLAARAEADPVKPVDFADVRLTDGFWAPRLETVAKVTIPYALEQCRRTGVIDNFLRAAHRLPPPHAGRVADDSDIYKVIEGAAYSLKEYPNPALEADLDAIIAEIAGAQEADGYLYTARTTDPANPPGGIGRVRWAGERLSHELYCAGHLYEAAVAYYGSTGHRQLLDVALKNADLLVRTFGNGPGQIIGVPGHEEVEIGLARLAQLTGDLRYVRLAEFFIDHRGRLEGRPELWGANLQDDAPVEDQDGPEGHAVRALYLYEGMAYAALADPGASRYVPVLDRTWNTFVDRRIYLTGGAGALHHGESFGSDYELPNDTAYCETCASVASVLWQERMFLLHRDARAIDVLERTLYNGVLAGISLGGDRFFYVNPLASDGRWPFNHGQGGATRAGWFSTPCCPTNLCRLLPAVPGLVYAAGDASLYVNLFISSEARTRVAGVPVEVRQQSGLPWSGQVRLELAPSVPVSFALRIRVPGWAAERPLPSDLYSYLDAAGQRRESGPPLVFRVNGEPTAVTSEKGYATIRRTWRAGDRVEADFPVEARLVAGNPSIDATLYRLAVERGPLVYCAEGADNGGQVTQISLRDDTRFEVVDRPELLGGIRTLVAGKTTLIPYYAWSNRGADEMAVWLPEDRQSRRW